jgi:asparaginyl-tRNA synthetase
MTKIEEILEGKLTGKEVFLRGWVYRKREQKEIDFVILRDSSGIIQLACKGLEEAKKATVESSIEIKGIVKKDERAPGGYEIETKDFKIIGLAETFPISKDLSEEFLREVRHLWIRSRKMTLMLKVRSEVMRAIHDFYHSKGFVEYQSPILTKAACEGGASLFSVDHPIKPLYLSQSWQLHAEAGIFALEKIYTITPAFRAEKSRTIRHLAEYWTAEMEAAWMTFEEMLEHEEELIIYVVKHILKYCKKELKELERDLKDLEELKRPFKRITYKEAIKMLGKEWGYDITDKEERDLVEKLGSKPVFITSFPRDMKAFYMKVDPEDSKTVLAADLLMPGIGEVVGGSERISDMKELLDSLKLFKLDRKDYEWYIDLRKYGSVPHSGFGLGIERLVMWITGAKHIMETIPFPRTMDRVYP